MNTSEEIYDKLFPHDSKIAKLNDQVIQQNRTIERMEAEFKGLSITLEGMETSLNWMRKHGVVLTHPTKGVLYLQGEEFDTYLNENRMSIKRELMVDEVGGFRSAPIKQQGQPVVYDSATQPIVKKTKVKKNGSNTGKES